MAKEYGVYGFCYYHYWFNGKMLLEQPMEQKFLEIKKSNSIFAYVGQMNRGQKHGLMRLKYKLRRKYGHEKEWKEHFDYLLPFFKDERYIKCSGRPLMVIYRPQVIDNIREMILYWNKLAKRSRI